MTQDLKLKDQKSPNMSSETKLPPISNILKQADPFHSNYTYQDVSQDHYVNHQPYYGYGYTQLPPIYNSMQARFAPKSMGLALVQAPISVKTDIPAKTEQQKGQANIEEPKRKTRNNLPKETTYILLNWLNEHLNHPYPNSFEKNQLMLSTGLNHQQLSNWFINARRRKIKSLKEQKKLNSQV